MGATFDPGTVTHITTCGSGMIVVGQRCLGAAAR